MLEEQQMKQVGIVVLGLAFVLWCWRSTRHAEDELLSPSPKQRRARGKRSRRKTRSRASSPTKQRHAAALDSEEERDTEDEEGRELADALDSADAGAAAPSRPTSPHAGMNDELRFIAQTSTDGTRVLKLESRSLADQGDSPSTRAFYEILGRYSNIVAEAEAAAPQAAAAPQSQPQPPTEAVLSRHNSLKRERPLKSKKDPNSPFASSPEAASPQSSSEEHEEEDVDEDDDLNHTTGSVPPSRAHHRPSLHHHGRRGRLSMNSSSSSRRYARSAAPSMHPASASARSSFHEARNLKNSPQGHALSPALSSNGLPQRRSSLQNYYTSGYRSENSSLRRSTGSSARSRSLSTSRSPSTLPPPSMYNHRRRMTANGTVLPPKSGSAYLLPTPGAQAPYDPMPNSPSTSHRNSTVSTHQPSPPPAYSSSGNSVQSSAAPSPPNGASPQRVNSKVNAYMSPGGPVPGAITDNGLDTEWEETDSMSDAFSLAESFDNDSTASNRVFATANVAAFSESDSLYRDEHVPLNRAAQHTERISRLKQLRENRRIPVSLQRSPQNAALSSTEAGGASSSSSSATQAAMVFGPYADEAGAQQFLNSADAAGGVPLPTPPTPTRLGVLSDVEEEGTEEDEVVPKRAAPRLLGVTQ